MELCIPLEADIFFLVTSSQDVGMATKSAPVCFIRRLLVFDSWVQVESIDTALAYSYDHYVVEPFGPAVP